MLALYDALSSWFLDVPGFRAAIWRSCVTGVVLVVVGFVLGLPALPIFVLSNVVPVWFGIRGGRRRRQLWLQRREDKARGTPLL
jgi:hypothetical protein